MKLRRLLWLGIFVLQSELWMCGAFGQVADPVLSVANGNSPQSSTVTVTITEPTPGAAIYYTTDGSTPTNSSASVASGGSVVISRGATFKVQAYVGASTSDLITASYTANGLIASGSQHALALKPDGTLWAWGNNSSGQLGNGNTSAWAQPGQVMLNGTPFLGSAPIISITSTTVAYENGLSIPWELRYFGQTGLNPNALSPSGDGNTLLNEYLQGYDPIVPVPVVTVTSPIWVSVGP